MVKRIFALCFFVFLFFTFSVSAITITGNPIIITGGATSATSTVSINVITPPVLTIVFPENATYLKTSIPINFTVSNGGVNNYSINDSANTTLSSNTTVTFANGFNTLHLWANNSDNQGQTHATRNFTVNTSLLTITYTNYNGSAKGDSIDFYSYPYENLTNISGLILENTNYGKIAFNESINVSNDSAPTDFAVDINSNIFILDNYIDIDSTDLPNFNKSATITIYNLTYSNPRILRDNAACPSTICSGKSYNSDTGTLIFMVTQFSKYSADETPSTSTASSSGGGGGGGSSSIDRHLDIIIEGIIKIGKGDQVAVPIKIYNTESVYLNNINLSATSPNSFLHPQFEKSDVAQLKPGENKTLMLFLTSDNDSITGNYEVKIEAAVTGPKFTEKASLFVQLLDVLGDDEVSERIKLAEDLFRENPECLELNDLLIRAQDLADEGDVSNAIAVVQEAVSRCRDLITDKEFPYKFDYNKLEEWRTPIEVALILIVVTLIIFLVFRRPKIELGGERPEKKKSFFGRIFRRDN